MPILYDNYIYMCVCVCMYFSFKFLLQYVWPVLKLESL